MQDQNSSKSMKPYLKYWKTKIQERKSQLKERKKELIKYAEDCSSLLKHEFGVNKVYLIGSLARDYKINEKTDIDLLVSGLPNKKYFIALNKLYKLVPKGVNIDLITVESISESMKKTIKKRL
jgi:predicted nucleotidyltransferase